MFYQAIATRIKLYFYEFSTFFDICFTNFLSFDVQRDLFDLIFDINIVMRYEIYVVCLKMIKKMTLRTTSCYEKELLKRRNKKTIIDHYASCT